MALNPAFNRYCLSSPCAIDMLASVHGWLSTAGARAVLDLNIRGLVQQDVVLRVAGVVLRVATRPVVADSVCVHGAVAVEGAAGDGLTALQHRLQPLLAVLVPKVERAIRPRCHERAIPAHGTAQPF